MPKKKKPKMIKAVVKLPKKDPYMTPISADPDDMRELLGGYIDEIEICTELLLLCDEDGIIKGRPYNFRFGSVDFAGTVVFVGKKKTTTGRTSLYPTQNSKYVF